jgi:hypothetical protein
MESITHLYDCTLGCNGEYRSSYDCTLDCNGEYCSPFSLYLRLQWRVSLTFMTVPKNVMESIAHLYDCALGCNGEYRSPF